MALTPAPMFDARIYYATADVTGFSNQVEFSGSGKDLDKSNFASQGWEERVIGLLTGQLVVTSFWQAGDLTVPDDAYWANLGLSTVPVTICPPTPSGGSAAGSVGTTAYLTRLSETEYKPGEKVGELLKAPITGKFNRPIARGSVLHPQGTARTVTGTGTGVQVGALLAGQVMPCNLHVLSYVDGTITVSLQSSVDNTFASPTTRLTFTASSALDAQAGSVVGPVTDTWWRAAWTIAGGATHSFLFNVSAGIAQK